MLRFASADEFANGLSASRCILSRATNAALFETAPELSSGVGNLVFTGDVDDPDTMRTLEELGFSSDRATSRASSAPGNFGGATAPRNPPRRASG